MFVNQQNLLLIPYNLSRCILSIKICQRFVKKHFKNDNFIMQKFVTQYIEPLLTEGPFPESEKDSKLLMLTGELKILLSMRIKNEIAAVNKQLAKKSRELFIVSADNETFRQTISDLQSQLSSQKSQYSSLEQQKTKQKLQLEREIAQITKMKDQQLAQTKKQLLKLKQDKELMQEEYKDKLREIKRQHQKLLTAAIQEEKQLQQEQAITMNRQFQEQRNQIVKDNNQKKRQLIKKYEDRIVKITGQYQDKLYALNKQFDEFKKQTKQKKSDLQNKLFVVQAEENRLRNDLKRQTEAHIKYKDLYLKISQELSEHQEKSIQEKEKVEQELHEYKKKLYQQQRKFAVQMKNMNELLQKTIQEKDTKYIETVMMMETQHNIKFDSMETRLIQQKQMAVNQVQVQRDRENYENQTRYQKLQGQFDILQKKYISITGEYQKKIKKIEEENQEFVENLNLRKQYELQVNGKNADREFQALKNKYQLQIKAIYRQRQEQLIEISKKHNDQKLALTNKLTTQYEAILSDQKSSTEIQIKQKLIEFERKAKGYQAKLKDAQKKRNQIKVAGQRTKMEMQMRIDSMVELNEMFENQIANFNEKLQDVQRQKQRAINDYQLKILLQRNQMEQTKIQFETREDDLKELLESKLKAKNKQMSIILAKTKRETDDLMNRNERRVEALQKQYNQLKKVVGQKTSLPEDIEALKIFHQAYITKQQQLAQEQKKIEYLRRELMAKQAMDKIFSEKGYKKIISSTQNIGYQTQYHSKGGGTAPNVFLSFKSNQI